jgi:hypothetical protein
MRRILILISLVLFLTFLCKPVLSAICGGSTPCSCGDAINESYAMTSDLDCNSGNGNALVIYNNASLNCNGHYINDTSGRALYISNASDVKNCVFRAIPYAVSGTGTYKEVIITEYKDNSPEIRRLDNFFNNTIITNGSYDLFICNRWSGCGNIFNNTFFNGLYPFNSIYASWSFSNNTIINCTYGLSVKSSVYDNNIITTKSGRAVFDYTSLRNQNIYFRNNIFDDYNITIITYALTDGDSPHNWCRNLSDTTVSEFIAFTSIVRCGISYEAKLVYTNMIIRNNTYIENTNVTFINVTFGIYNITDYDYAVPHIIGASITRKWYLDLAIKYPNGTAISNALVNITNSTGGLIFSGLTNGTGQIDRKTLTEYRENSSYIRKYSSPYTINVTKAGFISNSTVANLTTNYDITLNLEQETEPPQYSDISVTPAQPIFRDEKLENSEFNITVTDTSDITYVNLVFNNIPYSTTKIGDLYTYSFDINCQNYPQTYSYYWNMSDEFGNTNQTDLFSYTVTCKSNLDRIAFSSAIFLLMSFIILLLVINLLFKEKTDYKEFIYSMIAVYIILIVGITIMVSI